MKQNDLKDIPGFEGLYAITIDGQVWTYLSNRFKNLTVTKKGYLTVGLKKDGVWYKFPVHRLVLLTFIGPSTLQVNHKNGIKTDNYLENLEYCTNSQNQIHSYKMKLNWKTGERHECAKLNTQQVLEIRDTYKKEKITYAALARKYGVKATSIYKIIKFKTWKHI